VRRPPYAVGGVGVYLFDFNGVLVDDERVHYAAIRDVVARKGITLSEEAYINRYFAYDDITAFREILRDHNITASEELLAECVAEKLPIYMGVVEQELKMFEGGFALLRACAERGPVAIVSGALRVEIEFALNKADARVTTIVAAEDVPACKPDPAGYLEALRRLNVPASAAVVIEDSVGGIKAARAAGCRVVGVAHSYPEEKLSAATLVVSHIRELTVDVLDDVRRR
jgi:beta-phosphoglucomutase